MEKNRHCIASSIVCLFFWTTHLMSNERSARRDLRKKRCFSKSTSTNELFVYFIMYFNGARVLVQIKNLWGIPCAVRPFNNPSKLFSLEQKLPLTKTVTRLVVYYFILRGARCCRFSISAWGVIRPFRSVRRKERKGHKKQWGDPPARQAQ